MNTPIKAVVSRIGMWGRDFSVHQDVYPQSKEEVKQKMWMWINKSNGGECRAAPSCCSYFHCMHLLTKVSWILRTLFAGGTKTSPTRGRFCTLRMSPSILISISSKDLRSILSAIDLWGSSVWAVTTSSISNTTITITIPATIRTMTGTTSATPSMCPNSLKVADTRYPRRCCFQPGVNNHQKLHVLGATSSRPDYQVAPAYARRHPRRQPWSRRGSVERPGCYSGGVQQGHGGDWLGRN
jgi:hypothetical protein